MKGLQEVVGKGCVSHLLKLRNATTLDLVRLREFLDSLQLDDQQVLALIFLVLVLYVASYLLMCCITQKCVCVCVSLFGS